MKMHNSTNKKLKCEREYQRNMQTGDRINGYTWKKKDNFKCLKKWI